MTSKIRVRRFSDGSTRLRIKPLRPAVSIALFSVLFVFSSAFGIVFLTSSAREGGARLVVGLPFMVGALACLHRVLWHVIGGEEILINASALIRRKRLSWAAGDSALLPDISTIVVSGDGEDARLDLQLGRQRLEPAPKLGLRMDELRWVAARLREAVDRARSPLP
jgi:hypothetical protein